MTTRAVAEAAGVQAQTILPAFWRQRSSSRCSRRVWIRCLSRTKEDPQAESGPGRDIEPAGIFMLTLDCPIPRCTHLCIVIRNQEPVLLPQLQAVVLREHIRSIAAAGRFYG